jgi:flagellar hook assembly protein FlgD
VTTLVNARYPAGVHELQWDGTDAEGHRVASGLYFYRLEANGVETTRKMMLLK